MIGEAEATKDAIESAYQGLEESIHAAQPAAPAPVPSYEADLFGFNAPAPAPASQAAASAPAPVPAPIPYNQNQQQGHQVETVEDDTSAVEHEDFEENPEQSEHQDEWTQQQNNYGQQGLGMGMGPQGSVFRNDQGSSNNDLYGSGLDEHFRAHAPSGHNKQSSISSQLSFDRDGIMGGAPIPAMGGAPIPAAHFASPSHETNHYEDHGAQNDGPNLKDVEVCRRMKTLSFQYQ